MKVLHIIDHLGLGGAQSVVKTIFEAQRANDNIFLLALRNQQRNIDIDHQNVHCYYSSSKYSFRSLFEILEIVKKREICILHCHLPRSQFCGWLIKLIWFPELKLVFHEHGDIFGSQKSGWLANPLFARFLRLANSKINCLIAVSESTKKKLIEKKTVSPAKITVLLNPTMKIQKKSKTKARKESDPFTVGFAGRITEIKGWRVFLRCAETIFAEKKKICFLVAGDGPNRKALENSIRKSSAKKTIKYLGQVQDMANFYSQIDCLAVPSYWESACLVVTEAMEYGIPVIGSDVEAINEFISDNRNGLLFKPRDSQDLADKILLLHQDHQLRQRIVNAKGSGAPNPLEYGKKMQEIYEEM